MWDLLAANPETTEVVLRGHQATVISMAVSPDNRWLVTGSSDKTVRIWDLSIDSLIERARRQAGRELSAEEQSRFQLKQ
jgi:WD40 repeat protein